MTDTSLDKTIGKIANKVVLIAFLIAIFLFSQAWLWRQLAEKGKKIERLEEQLKYQPRKVCEDHKPRYMRIEGGTLQIGGKTYWITGILGREIDANEEEVREDQEAQAQEAQAGP